MEKDHLSRKLAVILHADVVGSTSLVQQNETLAHERIQAAFNNFSGTITAYGGKAHEIRGDAIVAEFERASDAVTAAIAFQTLNVERNFLLNDEIQPQLRIGISLGEVIIADNTITGAGVVLAQRLEQLADTGGVVVQGSISETVPTRMPFEFESLGDQMLKGFDQPVRAFAARLQPGKELPAPEFIAAPKSAESEGLQIPDKPSIAVLPFNNMSGDPEQEYFSDGITEDIITALSRISGLLVIARSSTMVYKLKAVDIKQVGSEQGVQYVLEGSVRKRGNRIRVTAQLIDATTGHHQWADRYDRELDDIFAVQDEITRSIAVEMRVQLTEGEQARMWAGGTNDVKAWELVCRSNFLRNRFVKEENLEARRLAEEAIRIDPYVNAWVELGFTHWMDAKWDWTESPNQSLERAREAAEKALEMEEDNADALGLLGWVLLLEGEQDGAVEVMEKAIRLVPNHASNTAVLADALFFAGRVDESAEKIKRAMQLSPIYPAWYLAMLGACYHVMKENELAISTLKEGIELEPDSPLCKLWLTSSLVEVGMLEEAKSVAGEVKRIEPNFSARGWKDLVFKDAAIKERIIENLLKAGLPD